MGDEDFEVVVTKNVILRQPLGQDHVWRQVLHDLRLPLPDNPLFQATKIFTKRLVHFEIKAIYANIMQTGKLNIEYLQNRNLWERT